MALTAVETNSELVIFLREIAEQQRMVLGWYQTAYEQLEDLKLVAMMHGLLTDEEVNKRQNLEVMKTFCERLLNMLGNTLFFASKELA